MVIDLDVATRMVTDAAALEAGASMVIDLSVVRGGSAVWPVMCAGQASMVLVAKVELAAIAMGRVIERDQWQHVLTWPMMWCC
jgi:hypothetical protein